MRFLPVALVLLLGCGAARAGEPPPETAEELLAGLADPRYQVRRRAVLAAEGRNEAAVLDRLIEIAQSDRNANMRGYAADVLGSFRDERIFPLLAKMARGEEYGPRTHAYAALGKLGDPRGKPVLLDGLAAGRGLRAYAAKGLGLLGDPEAFQPVAALLLKHVDDPYVAELAPSALVQLDKPKGLALLRQHFVAFPPHARIATAWVLGRHPDDETRTLMEGLLKEQDRALRLPAIQVLSELEDRKSTPKLLAHLKDRPEDRAAVIEALGKARDPRAAAPLIAALPRENDLLAKMRLIEALGLLGDKTAIAALLPLLDDKTLLAQPKTISAIWGFPWNTRVHAAAVWAILTLRDGKEPFPRTDLSRFPDGTPPARIAKDVAAIKKWVRAR